MEAINTIRMKILQDGTISVSTDAFEEEVHQQAEDLIKETFEALGGEVKLVENKREGAHTHVHHHGHVHNH